MKNHKLTHLTAAAVLLSITLIFGISLPVSAASPSPSDSFSIPEYTDEASVEVNDNQPFFSEEDAAFLPEQYYGELDALGRCTGAYAYLGKDLMPVSSRENISDIIPSGWQSLQTGTGGHLYERSHLIAYQLTGQNNERNLITGTEYLNGTVMKAYEDKVAEYVSGTGNHVMYRVTPVFEGDDLVAVGVLMEARSVEDDRICFCVYCFNVQPGEEIDYSTGALKNGGIITLDTEEVAPDESITRSGEHYIANTNTRKFHYPYCSSVSDMKEKNKLDFYGSREELINRGYTPCGRCHP